MEDLTNILKNNDDGLNEEKLKKYLSGSISEADRYEIEKQMADSDFVNDAMEGLQTVSDKQKLNEYVNHLNKDLRQYLAEKKQVKEKRKIKDLSWIIIAVIVILLLCILAYVIIMMQHEKQLERSSISVQYLNSFFQQRHIET
jgi:hypothetical protein